MPLIQADFEELFRLEQGLWRPETRQSPAWMDGILADGFVEFGATGRAYSRYEVVVPTSGSLDVEFPLPEFKARMLTSDVALITYVSVQRPAEGGERRTRRSSVWIRTGDHWKLAFHQGTLVGEEG